MTQEALEGFRLSLQQKRVWRLQHLDSYRTWCSVMLTGNLDTVALQEALRQAVQRHEILRTTFQGVAGLEFPLQVIATPASPLYQAIDLCHLPPQAQSAIIAVLCQDEQRRPFDYARGPLLHVSLLALARETHLLLISLPALCGDTRALQNLLQEVAQNYAASPRQAALPEVTVQYADFAAWQQQLLDTDAAGKAYWHEQDIAGGTTCRLPGAGSLTSPTAELQQTLDVTLSAAVLAQLTMLACQENTSLEVLLLASWQLLLWRLSEHPDITVGYVCDGRNAAELQDAMGLFVRTLPIRGHFATLTSWQDVLHHIHQAVHLACTWMDAYPESHRLDTTFAVGFSYATRPASQTYGDVTFAVQQQHSRSDRLPLHLYCERRDDTLLLEFAYEPDCFPEQHIRHLAERFVTLLDHLSAAPQTPIQALTILGPIERQQLLEGWNDTPAAQAPRPSLQQLLAAQAAQTPDAIAVLCEDACLTYQALHDRAEQIAGHLQAVGVGPEVLVGICMERSLDLIVSILAILKAGGVYVPLDPTYPRERLAFMLNDAQVQVLLTQQKLLPGLPAHAARVFCPATDWPFVAQQRPTRTIPRLAPDNLAYVMYTSGSTGEPRGVMITQGNVSHYVQALQARLKISATERYLHTASVAFSSSVRQLLLPLLHGASLVIATPAQLLDPLALCQVIKQHQVTVLDILPSYWRGLTQALHRLSSTSRSALLDNALRLLMTASEALPSDIPALWQEGFQHPARLLNMFGQTETTGIVALYPIARSDSAGVPIGRPIARTPLYLLDTGLQPVPIGVAGELCVAGQGLARGYWRHPELTAQKFLPHPFRAEPGARLYRTGDLARYLPDGTLVFLGRRDQQVKIRGVRIEPGEIAALLNQHPAVATAVVVGREEAPAAGQRLLAYVVPREALSAGAHNQELERALRQFLQHRLPEYMVPSAFVFLDALPLTANGKINRQALPLPLQASVTDTVAPRTPVEAEVARIWAEVLGRAQVGIHDNFFEAGGHSLLAAQVIYRLREAFLVELPLPSLFAAPTVAGVAAVIAQEQSVQQEHALIAQTLADLEHLSETEVQALLAHQEGQRHETSC